jgi:hypothetical protein
MAAHGGNPAREGHTRGVAQLHEDQHSTEATPPQPPASASEGAGKIADRPHNWTIGLSVLALVVSGISLYVSYQGVVLNKRLSGALVQVTGLDLSATAPNGVVPEINAIVSNVGKTVAEDLVVEVHSSDFWPPTTGASRDHNLYNRNDTFRTLGPGVSVLAQVFAYGLPKSQGEDPQRFYVFGILTYRDGLTGERRSSKWCYSSGVAADSKVAKATSCPMVPWLLEPVPKD